MNYFEVIVDARTGTETIRPYTPDEIAAIEEQANPVPTAVTPRQFRLALNQLSLREAVEAAVAASDQDTKDTWEFATEVRRDNPELNAMAEALGLSPSQLDDIFILANTK